MADAVPAAADTGDALLFEVVNQVGLFTLNRPQALNALGHAMVLRMAEWLDHCEHDPEVRAVAIRGAGSKAFCAGGDVIALFDSAQHNTPLHREFFVDEYQLIERLHGYSKPVAALMHGVVMGGGMGLAQAASLRLVTAHTRIAMPECRIGLIPDVGATYFFSRMPAPMAHYLALTGITIGADDAIFVGLADAHAAVEQPDALPRHLQAIDWDAVDIADTQAALHAALTRPASTHIDQARLPALCPAVYRHFDPGLTVQRIADSLAAEQQPAWAAWARDTHDTLVNTRSPLMLCLCHEALRRGRRMALGDCLSMELTLVRLGFNTGEFREGVRALLIDKDQTPQWRYRSLADVPQQVVSAAFP